SSMHGSARIRRSRCNAASRSGPIEASPRPWRAAPQSGDHHVQINLPAATATTQAMRNRNIETAKLACFLNSLRPSFTRVVRRKKTERMKRKTGIAAARKAMILKIIVRRHSRSAKGAHCAKPARLHMSRTFPLSCGRHRSKRGEGGCRSAMRRPLAGVGRDVQNALERHIVASKSPRDLPHNVVAYTGTENRGVCGHSSTREHQQRTVHD